MRVEVFRIDLFGRWSSNTHEVLADYMDVLSAVIIPPKQAQAQSWRGEARPIFRRLLLRVHPSLPPLLARLDLSFGCIVVPATLWLHL